MNTDMILDCGIISATFILSLFLTLQVRKFLLRRALLDHPNERSSHTVPTPRGGGWALLIVLIPGIILTTLIQDNFTEHLGLLLGVLLLTYISWLDDKKGVSAVKRLSLHILAACLGSMVFTPEQTLFVGALPFWLDRAIMIIGWAWFINLYNFMDGIDGITSVETISLATGTCLLLSATNISDPFVSTLTLLLTGVCLGFLVLNWHPAKIFLGDVGSVPLGFLTGFGLLSIATKGHLIPALILPLYYLADSGITITKRAMRGEKIWQAHRQHFYQQAVVGIKRHDKVVNWIIYANISLIIAALFAIDCLWMGITVAVVSVAILLRKMHKTVP